MREPVDIPLAHGYGPWWRPALVGLSVIAALLITTVTGVGVGIVVGAIAVADTAGLMVLTIVRAHRHKESLRAAAAWARSASTAAGDWRSDRTAKRTVATRTTGGMLTEVVVAALAWEANDLCGARACPGG